MGPVKKTSKEKVINGVKRARVHNIMKGRKAIIGMEPRKPDFCWEIIVVSCFS